MPYLQYPCQLCRKTEGKLNVFGYFGCKGCANKIKTKEQADDVFNEMETIDRLTAEKEMLREALSSAMEYMENDIAYEQTWHKVKKVLTLTAPSKESDIEQAVRQAGQR